MQWAEKWLLAISACYALVLEDDAEQVHCTRHAHTRFTNIYVG